MLGMKGPNLAEEHQEQILMHTPETPVEKIKKIDDLRFEVQSSLNFLNIYQIDLTTITCNCSDFLNISLCKHIATVVHFFGGADLRPRPPCNKSDSASESAEHSSPSQPVGHHGADNAAASIVLAANKIISLSHRLITEASRDPEIAKSLNIIELRLNALVILVTATDNGSWLPEKDYIALNQHSWMETAARMEESHRKKRSSKVDSALTAQHIREPNCKQAANEDLYGAKEQSGKQVKPNARSATANALARKWAVPKAEPLPTQSLLMPLPPLASLPLPMPPPCISFPTYPYHYPTPASLSQPMYPPYFYSQPASSQYYPFSTYSHFTYTYHM